MSRVTFREPSGKWGIKGVSWDEVPDGLYGALYKLRRYEDICEDTQTVEALTCEDDFTSWRLVDPEHNVWQCGHCLTLHQFEADGPEENGFVCCPYCAQFIERTGGEDANDEPA